MLHGIKTIGATYWIVVGIGAVLTLARFSEAFLILRAQTVGLSPAWAPLVLVVMNIVYALSAYPLGALSDRIDRKLMLAIGFGLLIGADVILAVAPDLPTVMAGVAVWGLHMGMTQGLLSALVADEAPQNLRATAFGVFNFVSGLALLLASIIAGTLWELVGPYAIFIAETYQLLPAMGWGLPNSPGHYLDLVSAVLGGTLLPLGLFGNVFNRSQKLKRRQRRNFGL
jgi:MFS family permease